MKILVADDDPLERRIVANLLAKCGHEVMQCSDGEMAWQLVQSEGIRLVVSDWLMPKLTGIDLCHKIRGASLDRYVYVILCTSKGEKADFIQGMDAGADDFIVKPVHIDDLRVRVRAGERILNLERNLSDKNQELEVAHAALQTAYEHIQDDLKAAAWVQMNLLPPPELKALGVACNWRFRPSSYISGDIFNFFAVDSKHVGFYLLDVSGHGVPAAMCSMALSLELAPDGRNRTPLRRYDRKANSYEAVEPSDVITELNTRFQTRDDRYFTMTYGVLNAQTSVLRLAQAGNPNPVLIERRGKATALSSGGMPVGLWPDMVFDSIEVPFQCGDRLVLYSDGVSECANADEVEFGDARLLEYLKATAHQPLEETLNGLEKELEAWRGSTDFADDVSVLALEFMGEHIQ
ncbi:MAG TPA: SpoIIE family protein phosphatase [Bryobacteraceae bacterium]|nr:SpoIIE family protein phosphatase [Bryobacteraceae bacterium]